MVRGVFFSSTFKYAVMLFLVVLAVLQIIHYERPLFDYSDNSLLNELYYFSGIYYGKEGRGGEVLSIFRNVENNETASITYYKVGSSGGEEFFVYKYNKLDLMIVKRNNTGVFIYSFARDRYEALSVNPFYLDIEFRCSPISYFVKGCTEVLSMDGGFMTLTYKGRVERSVSFVIGSSRIEYSYSVKNVIEAEGLVDSIEFSGSYYRGVPISLSLNLSSEYLNIRGLYEAGVIDENTMEEAISSDYVTVVFTLTRESGSYLDEYSDSHDSDVSELLLMDLGVSAFCGVLGGTLIAYTRRRA